MVNPKEVSLILITKDPTYPHEIWESLEPYPFGEVLVMCDSDSPFNKHKLFANAKYDLLAYQDDDAICPWKELFELSDPNIINAAIKPGHFEAYKHTKMLMGLGWGAIFPKKLLSTLKQYTDVYGEDEVFRRETERIFTYLNYPQNRLVLPIEDLPSATDGTRLWQQPEHNEFKRIAQERCGKIIE